MPQLTVPIVRTAALPAGYCYPPDAETFFEDIVARIQGVFINNFTGVIISSTAPGVNDRDKLWFNTNNSDNNIYHWETAIGGWGREHPFRPSSTKRVWFKTVAEMKSEDGGNTNSVNVGDGPFWEEDTTMSGTFALAIGDVPGTTPVVTITEGSTGGAYEHVLTEAEGANGVHTHAFGKYLDGAADFNYQGDSTVPSYTGAVVQGISGGSVFGPDTIANLYTLPSGNTGTGVNTPDPIPLMPPWTSGLWAKRTIREFILPL